MILFQPPLFVAAAALYKPTVAWLLICLLGSLGKQSWHAGYRNQLHGRSSCEYYPISDGRSPAYGKTEGGLLPISHIVGNWPWFTTNLLLTTSVLACMSNYKLGLSGFNSWWAVQESRIPTTSYNQKLVSGGRRSYSWGTQFAG